MELTLERTRDTPIFCIRTKDVEPFKRLWGAIQQEDRWIYPAYYPFGLWVYRDIRAVLPGLRMAPEAIVQLNSLKASHERVARAQADFDAGRDVELNLPAGFRFHIPPFRHQKLGILLGVLNWRLFYLWSMRTGKTKTMIETLRILRAQGAFRRALVIGPPIVRAVWETETAAHSNGELTTYPWEPSDPGRLVTARKHDIVLATYAGVRIEYDRVQAALVRMQALKRLPAIPESERLELAASIANRLTALDFDVIIGDESHQFGNWDSRQTQAVLELSRGAARRYALSGTAGDQPAKFYPQLRYLSEGLMPLDWASFQKRFFVFSQFNRHVVTGFRHMDDMNQRVDRVATRMRQEDCLDMPERTVQNLWFRMGPVQKTRYNEMVRDMRATELPVVLNDRGEWEARPFEVVDGEAVIADEASVLVRIPHGGARITKLLQATSGFLIKSPDLTVCDGCQHLKECVDAGVRPYTPDCHVVKQPPPVEVIRDFENPKLGLFETLMDDLVVQQGEKVVCWGVYRQEIDDMREVCRRRGWGVDTLDASSRAKVRDIQERFREDPAFKVVLGQVSSGIGIDLTPARNMVFYQLPWDRTQYRQALERNSGPRQKRSMAVYRLIAADTVAEFVGKTLSFKDKLAYTLAEKIACATCYEQERCGKEENEPFRKGCIYSPDAERPMAQVKEIK